VGVIIGKGSGEYLPRRGDLLRWIVDYKLFAADDKGNAWPHNPVYEYSPEPFPIITPTYVTIQ
jgi:hypothetical protein